MNTLKNEFFETQFSDISHVLLFHSFVTHSLYDNRKKSGLGRKETNPQTESLSLKYESQKTENIIITYRGGLETRWSLLWFVTLQLCP